MADIVVNRPISTSDVEGFNAALDGKANQLTANKTVNIPYGSTAAEIQALIDAEPKVGGATLTFQFEDCPYKYFNGTTDKIVGDGTTATVTHAAHGFSSGHKIGISTLREQYFSGSTTIVGNGTTATVTRNSHGFKSGDTVVIAGTTNFNGTYVIGTVATNTFVITHAYSGEETPPVTASIDSLDFDGIYEITVTDENTYTFASTITGTTTPLTKGIARRAWELETFISFRSFSNILLSIIGNTTTETDRTTAHNNQRVLLYCPTTYAIQIYGNNCNIDVSNISFVTGTGIAVVDYYSKMTMYKYCSMQGSNQIMYAQETTNTLLSCLGIGSNTQYYYGDSVIYLKGANKNLRHPQRGITATACTIYNPLATSLQAGTTTKFFIHQNGIVLGDT